MWKFVKIAGIFIFLFFCSIQDIKEKRVSISIMVIFGALFWIAPLLFEERYGGQRICNILPGLAAFAIAFLTKEQIGYGDAVCLIVLGGVVSADVLLGAVMGGLILLSACSVILLAGKRADRKTTLPFLPFLAAGMLLQIGLGII